MQEDETDAETNTANIRGYVYNIKHKPLGEGTYGVVHRGTNTNTTPRHPVAIKIVSLYGKEPEAGVSCELLREFSFLETMRQSGDMRGLLCPIDMFVHENTMVMIYPLLEETLFTYMTRTQSRARRQNIGLYKMLVDELIYACHFCAQYNIRHNDVHASNVLVSIPERATNDQQPVIKLTDLGLCTFEPALPWLAWSNTYEWSYYQAPELAKCLLNEPIHRSFTIDSRVDMWSLGVIIIEYGAPQVIKERVKAKVHPQYMYDKQAHKTNHNDPYNIRLSMNGSTDYYNGVIHEWKEYMFTKSNEIADSASQRFYTRLFMLLQNIFTSYKMRWNIRTCFEYWIEHRTKLVIRDYLVHDHAWLSKFAHVLTRLQQHPVVITYRMPASAQRPKTELPIWANLVQYWFDESHNLIYTLECMRLLYEYVHRRPISNSNSTYSPNSTEYVVYRKNDKRWVVAFVLPCAEWEELYQALFGLAHKLLHNAHRHEFKTNAKAERRLLEILSFDAWSSWIQAPICKKNEGAQLSFDPRHAIHDLQRVQSICNNVSKSIFPGIA